MAIAFGRSLDTSVSAGMQTSTSAFFCKRTGIYDLMEQSYCEPLSFTLQIVSKDYSDFDTARERDIKKWLCKRGMYSWFHLEAPGYESIWWKVNISNPRLLCAGRVVGMEFDCVLDAPWGYSPMIEKTFAITTDNKSISLYVHTDEDNYIYPWMQITMKDYGDLSIVNSSELKHRDFSLANTVTGERITVDNAIPDIFSSQNEHEIYSDFNKHWLRLVDGENKLTFSKSCNVTLKYREIRKAGIFT